MKYKLEVENGRSVETLTVNGKEYKCEGVQNGNITSYSDDFCWMLENDGFDDDEVLDAIWDVLDSETFTTDIIKLCSMAD